MVFLKKWGWVIAIMAMAEATLLICVKSQSAPPSLEGWRHANRVAESSFVDKVAISERDGDCRQLLVGCSGETFVNDWFTLTRRDPTQVIADINPGMDGNTMERRWEYASTQFNRELVDELNHDCAWQRLWFVNANTIGIIGELKGTEGGKAIIRFLDLRSGFIQTVNLDEKLGLLDLGVIHISPWNGLIAIASHDDKAVWMSKIHLRNDGRWQVVSTDLVDDTRRQIKALAISPDGKMVYCLDDAESVILRWRIGKSTAWECVGGGYPTVGKYVGNIAVDRRGDIACVRHVHEGISGDGVYLDRYNPAGERKRRIVSKNGDIDQTSVSFTRNGAGACVLVSRLAKDSRLYSVNFLGSTSSRKVTNNAELVAGQNAYVLCHNVDAPNHRVRSRRDTLYEITP